MGRTILFDLDGTLADTAPDFAFAVNTLRREHGLDELPYELIRARVSMGSAALIEAAFAVAPGAAMFDQLRQRLLEIYRENLSRETRLFPGMSALLDELDDCGTPWGIVTNKPAWLTEPLLVDLGLGRRPACTVSGDTTAKAKPHPEPLLHAARLVRSSPRDCVYVGDAARDVEAGHRAGMLTLVALFGYVTELDRPECWGADGLIREPQEILDWI